MGFHVEGMEADGTPLPRPSSLDDVMGDPALAAWRESATIVHGPLLIDRGTARRVNVSLDPGLLEAVDDEARRRGMTRSAFLSSAARAEIRGRKLAR